MAFTRPLLSRSRSHSTARLLPRTHSKRRPPAPPPPTTSPPPRPSTIASTRRATPHSAPSLAVGPSEPVAVVRAAARRRCPSEIGSSGSSLPTCGMGLWDWLWGRRGLSGFGAESTAEEVTAGVDASHLTAIVTGATNGIGRETARVLALRGAKVIMPTRTLESGMKVKESILEQIPCSNIHVMEMDLCSLDSVRSFTRSFLSSHEHLNILINNAGIMGCPFQLSKNGIELQFATNHVGHFLLTNLLLDKMKKTARETGVQGRIINVSSMAYKGGDGSCFDLKKLNDSRRYHAFTAYCHSKLANILHANELARRFQEEGCALTANSLHPGMIATNISRYIITNTLLIRILSVLKPFLKSIPQGAATTCYLALHPDVKDVSGKYFADCNEVTPSAIARNTESARKLWEFSKELSSRE